MPQTTRSVFARARGTAWKMIRPIVLAVDWLLGSVFGSHKAAPNDADIEAARYETDARVGPPPPYGGGSGPPL